MSKGLAATRGPATQEDIVDRLWESDAASAVTNEAAREITALRAALVGARKALEPFEQVAYIYRDRTPQHGDVIQAWEFTSGSAELRVSHCMEAQLAGRAIDKLLGTLKL